MFGYISHYEGMETGDIVARVVEGRVNKVNVVHVDDEGNPRKAQGEVSPDIVLRELPFKVSCPRPPYPFQVHVSELCGIVVGTVPQITCETGPTLVWFLSEFLC